MTIGAVALVGAPTLGYGITGAGVALVMDGAGTTHGDGIVGAGAVASVGAVVMAGPVAGDLPIGVVALAGAGAAMAMAGTEDIIEDITIEAMHTIEVEEDIPIV
ncbi:hypothetical protein DKG77_07680 [Flagellimonas aquimarina]|uniref:Uncharacterized protein n=1 Tax=Flagellimonas aquimarina TaxID=2201895 RepID=A0A316KYG9_9FLAO|nr:hypothetical protein DKG77_07680 [Allomuricauda koreensis]